MPVVKVHRNPYFDAVRASGGHDPQAWTAALDLVALGLSRTRMAHAAEQQANRKRGDANVRTAAPQS